MPPKLARMRKSASRRPTGVFCSRVPKILRHVPPEGVAECGTEGVGDEIIDITGAVCEQLGAFDE